VAVGDAIVPTMLRGFQVLCILVCSRLYNMWRKELACTMAGRWNAGQARLYKWVVAVTNEAQVAINTHCAGRDTQVL
jgi:hypothetical protein